MRDDGGPISTTRSSTSTPCMIAVARSGASGASWSPRAPSGGGAALGTSSSFCGVGASSHRSNRWRTITRLARLGLRAGDVRDMRLDDIDWRGGYIRVKGKTRRPDRLPLPQAVGDAILAYLAAARPKAVEDHLFLRVQAPFRPFSSSAGDRRHRRTHARARWGSKGADRVAHIPAFRLPPTLRAGAGLESVGTILRHSSPETTAIYAGRSCRCS
ncbi:MAG: tyrosine-type recombinase/integrase [Sphingomonadales bacterium]|nr:tyrosine-type recombinase/integrase [Sphingomonadales bacterium]